MRLPGHIAGAWITSKLVIDRLDISPQERINLSLLSVVVGTIPDWDYLWYMISKKGIKYESDFRHHTWITHTFPFYWVISGLIYLVGIIIKKPSLKNQATIFAVATSTHLAQDMVGSGDGIMALYPATKKMYGVGLSGLHGKAWNDNYVKSPSYLVEIGLIIIACIMFVLSLFRKRI
jgi:membrane-bound metal-dependent hydrolase YbcI (DUF457 family)